jgi:hypothetical protein
VNEHVLTLPLDGLDGTNPVGFLAGLGVLAILDHRGHAARLSWTQGVVPRARIAGVPSIGTVIDEIIGDKDAMADEPLLGFPPDSPTTDVKFGQQADVREYLTFCRTSEPSASLSTALLCEGAVDNKKQSKPTDLHFTAGRQQFLGMTRQLQREVTHDDIERALRGPWQYDSTLPSFKWDSADDRDYALAPVDPAKETKLTAPGVEWLAFRGLRMFPIVERRGRVLTPGAGGDWKAGWLTWPLWRVPLSCPVARTLIQSVPRDQVIPDTYLTAAKAWGVHRLMRSRITRSDQGGYGSFRSPMLVWSNPTTPQPGQLSC